MCTSRDTSIENQTSFIAEMNLMKKLSATPHRNIIQLLGVCTDAEPLLMILELAGRGDLRSLLIRTISRSGNSSFGPVDLLYFALDIVQGMMFLQTKNIIHRDLACRNCFVADDMTVKIGDFGLSRAASISDYYQKEGLKTMPIRWSPPEVLANGFFSSYSDVWSFGVVMWELFALGETPYVGYSGSDVAKYVTNGYRLEAPSECDDRIYMLMRHCWKTTPESRPTFIALNEIIMVLAKEISAEQPVSTLVSSAIDSHQDELNAIILHTIEPSWDNAPDLVQLKPEIVVPFVEKQTETTNLISKSPNGSSTIPTPAFRSTASDIKTSSSPGSSWTPISDKPKKLSNRETLL